MKQVIRIVVIILCVAALFYLVVTLARSVSEQDTGLLDDRAVRALAAAPGGGTPAG